LPGFCSTWPNAPRRKPGADRRHADQLLGNREWVLGCYSIADIHLFRLFWRFTNSLKPPPGSFPNLEAHYTHDGASGGAADDSSVRQVLQMVSADLVSFL
jgi:glutathione S-transferase